MDRFTARENVIRFAEEKGFFRGKPDHSMRLATCSRSGDIIEPILHPQWYSIRSLSTCIFRVDILLL